MLLHRLFADQVERQLRKMTEVMVQQVEVVAQVGQVVQVQLVVFWVVEVRILLESACSGPAWVGILLVQAEVVDASR